MRVQFIEYYTASNNYSVNPVNTAAAAAAGVTRFTSMKQQSHEIITFIAALLVQQF